MAELGQTNDPTELVPGKVGSIESTIAALDHYGDVLDLAGRGLGRIGTRSGWQGAAADAFHARFQSQPAKWIDAGDAFHAAATALSSYASTLSWAQNQAGQAIILWNSGQNNHQAAQQTLDRARNQLTSAGATAAASVGKARDQAPPTPSIWARIGSAISSFSNEVDDTGDTLVTSAVGAVASFGNAILHDPKNAITTIAGVGLTVVSGAGDVAGGALDVTGIGALVGVPLNIVSTAGVVGGISLAGAGLHGLAEDAAGPDRVNMSSGGSSGGFLPRSYTSNLGKISKSFDYPPKQINDAIHAVKNQGGWRGLGANRNPDIVIDTNTGEVYPKLPGGGVSEDSIGNILDYLDN